MAPAVSLRSVVALVGRFPVLAGTDLEVATGEVVLLRGPNGAGKTSLLRACAGLLPIASGEVSVLGHDLRQDRRSVRRRVGLLGHAGFLYDDLSAEENLRFVARAGEGAGGGAGIGPVLARLGLVERLRDVPVGRLSAGQRRRVSIAALVVRRPLLWLLDEPHAGLDAESRELLDRMVREAVTEGATVLFTSHEGDRVTALADRAVTMSGGQVRAPSPREPRKRVHVA
ncbi:MAG: heme ABC exporter ATP-binding protein CcmA [Actinomycetota bacterium]|nr:heme ABC exporter ATP-binding protein CcmA [Actinomycetota bacterium]